MELSVLDMYWLVKLDDIRDLFAILGFLSVLPLAGVLTFYACKAETTDSSYDYRSAAYGAIVWVFFVCGCIFTNIMIPSTKQMAAIIVVPKIVNNAQVQELPNKLLDLSTAWLEELKPKEAK